MKATWALLPVKGINNAKQRLEGVLSPAQREQLCLALLADLLACLSASRTLGGVLVVCGEPGLQTLVEQAGADFLVEPEEVHGLNDAVSWGLAQLQARAVARALVLHGDLPLATTAAIDQVLNDCRPEHCSLGLLPDWRGDGTNALLTPLPLPIELQYGQGSFQKHCLQASQAGLKICKLAPSPLAFDIDTPQDLTLLQQLVTKGFGSPQTRLVIESLPVAAQFLAVDRQWRDMTTHSGLAGK